MAGTKKVLFFAAAPMVALAFAPVVLADGKVVSDGCSGEDVEVSATDLRTSQPSRDSDATSASNDEVTPPVRFLKTRGRRCGRYRGRRFCDGPLRVAAPYGEAAELARTLGLGTRSAATHLLLHAPEQAWVDAVEAREPVDLLWPVAEGRFWRGFGRQMRRSGPKARRRSRARHEGVDIGAHVGTPIRAVADGIVAYSNNEVRGYGNLIMVVHADASVTFYAHCQAAYVFPGQRVTTGQVIGEVGQTGLARGPHLHFEYRVNGRPRDPMKRFERRPPGA